MPGRRRDPVETRDDGSQDLYEIADWEVRSRLDWFVHGLYHLMLSLVRGSVVLAAVAILVSLFVIGSLGAITEPVIGAFTLLSVLPALGLAAFVWYSDVTTSEPLSLLVVTFVLGVLFAGFAGLANSAFEMPVTFVGSGFGLLPPLGMVVFFFVIVGPVEEAVKLLAVRLFAYRDDRFDAVIDGAVYGAVAGLGFATIENALYITQQTDATVSAARTVSEAGGVAVARTLAGPGHVLYSAFAGYYLGLAKFNREHAGPIVLKGLLLAAIVHATYNTLSGVVPPLLSALYGLDSLVATFVFVLVYDGIFGLILLRKLSAYGTAYREAYDPSAENPSELTEFEP